MRNGFDLIYTIDRPENSLAKLLAKISKFKIPFLNLLINNISAKFSKFFADQNTISSKKVVSDFFSTYFLDKEKSSTTEIFITGHSLGAGTAVLLSMMLKPKYPKIRCFAFSPPGGLLNQAAARYTETFCMSVIIGDDLVPRLSLVTLELLKNQLVSELDACRHPKVR